MSVTRTTLPHLRRSFSSKSTLPPFLATVARNELKFYKNKLAYNPKYPLQLIEYTFADVKTTVAPPSIIDLHVGYNVSYLDQVYLQIALAPCLKEHCNQGTRR